MSYTNETTYYGLPLPTGSDKSTFPDNNTAFQAVDAALHTAYEGAATAAEDITSLKGRMSDAETDIDNLETDLGTEKGKIVALQNKETLQDGEIADVRSDCEGMVCAYNEATSTSTHAYSVGDYFIYNDVLYVATDSITVGATIVPDTNCETTDVATVLKSQAGNVGDLSDLTTTDKSSAVAAINEVKSDLGDLEDETVRARYIGTLNNFEAMGSQMNGWGFVVDLPTSMDLTITSARFFGDDGQWHDLNSPTIKNSFGKQLVWGNQTLNGATNGKTYLVQLTGTSAKPTV